MGSDSNSDSGADANKAPSLLENFVEDLTSVFNGTANSPHSAHDVRSANAMQQSRGGKVEDYLPGGDQGPRGGSYSPRAHQRALASQGRAEMSSTGSATVASDSGGGDTDGKLSAVTHGLQQAELEEEPVLGAKTQEVTEEAKIADVPGAMGAKPQTQTPIVAGLTEPATLQTQKAVSRTAPLPEDPEKAPVASPYSMGQEDIAKKNAKQAAAEKAQAKVEAQKQSQQQAAIKGFVGQVQAAQRNAAAKAQRSTLAELAALSDQERSLGLSSPTNKGQSRSQADQSPYGPVQAWSGGVGLSTNNKAIEVNLPSAASYLGALAPVEVEVPSYDLVGASRNLGKTDLQAERQAKANRLTGQSKRNRDLIANRVPSPFDQAIAEAMHATEVGARATQRSVTLGYLDMLAGVTSTIGPAFGLQTNWSKYEALKSRINALVQPEDENTLAAQVGGTIGDGLLTAAELGVFAGGSRSAGEKAYKHHQQGKTTKSQMQSGIGSYALGATTDRLSRLASVATRMGTVGFKKATNLLEEGFTALEIGVNASMNYGLDLLAEKSDDEKQKGKRVD